ncbi:MAG TPA: GNAT family N-acetyltransferase [Caulobacterales bacterium]|nr:GNAT family N-acetyltransferase [Caulobacterales bacterium]
MEVRDNVRAQRFEIEIEGQFAIAEYKLADGVITFTHTEVPAALGGRGLGTRLIRAGLDAARERGLKVIPECPFFAKYMREHAETHDLIHPAHRKILAQG